MPAAFNVQVDAGTTVDANAYIDVAFFKQYFLDRGVDVSAAPLSWTDTQIKYGIVLATDYIDNRWRLRFAGTPLTEDQTTEFPRDNIASDTGKDLSATLPIQLKKATAEYGYRAVQNGSLVADAPRPVVGGELQPAGEVLSTSVTVGPITDSKTYAQSFGGNNGGTPTTDGSLLPEIPAADMLIEYLLDSSSSQRRVIRS